MDLTRVSRKFFNGRSLRNRKGDWTLFRSDEEWIEFSKTSQTTLNQLVLNIQQKYLRPGSDNADQISISDSSTSSAPNSPDMDADDDPDYNAPSSLGQSSKSSDNFVWTKDHVVFNYRPKTLQVLLTVHFPESVLLSNRL